MNTNSRTFGKGDVEVMLRSECHDGFLRVERLQLRHRLFSGAWSDAIIRELQLKEPAVGILLFDPQRDVLLLVRQFRVGMLEEQCGPWPLELVAGMVSKGEQLEEVALRESQEESNCVPTDLVEICTYYNSPGTSNEKVHLYCGRINSEGAGGVYGLADEHEDIEVVPVDYDYAVQAMNAGVINNAMSIIALQWLQLNKQDLLNNWK
jgi:ADP-ribose pyrophosphatase